MSSGWTETYAGIYEATCRDCGFIGRGWFWLNPDNLSEGRVCSGCYPEENSPTRLLGNSASANVDSIGSLATVAEARVVFARKPKTRSPNGATP